jgi:putative transposase
MRRHLTRLHVHISWTTLDSAPLITSDLEPDIHAQIRKSCVCLKVRVTALGGSPNHVQLLVEIPPMVSVSQLMRIVKSATASLASRREGMRGSFKWHPSYAAFSVSEEHVAMVSEYIRGGGGI